MQALVDDMVQDEPSKRPSSEQALKRFEDIRSKLTSQKLRARVADRDEEGGFSSVTRRLSHVYRRVQYSLSGLPPVPTR